MAPAKVNLFLHVGAKRQDGFHDLQSLVVFGGNDLADRLEIGKADDFRLELEGEFAREAGAVDQNLVMQAARSWRQQTGHDRGAHMKLVKNLPAGAGLGGGSSDAAACLRALDSLYETGLSATDLADMGAALGADIPVCLRARPCHVSGVGESLCPARIPELPAVIVHCREKLETGRVFSCFDSDAPAGEAWKRHFSVEEDLLRELYASRNDLTASAGRLCPKLHVVLEQLSGQEGARMVRMSGSGPACFALFSRFEKAQAAALNISCAHPEWWVRACVLAGFSG